LLPEIGGFALYENMQNPESIYPCIDWAFWNANDVDPNLDWSGEGPDGGIVAYGGCPHYTTKEISGTVRFGVIAVCGFFGPWFSYKHFLGAADRIKKARSEALEKYLPYAASYTAAMSAANATPANIFRSLAVNEDIYGDIAYDSAMIYRDITLLGMDLVTAIRLSVGRAASPWVSEFFQGMVGTLSSGGSLKIYFLNRAEHYMRENRIRMSVFLEALAMMAESYVVVAVAMPLFLIVMLVIMFWVSGAGSQISETMVYGVVLGVLPMIHIAYSILIYMMSKEMEM
jgi:archaellum biogenesis protein FlaJ (TadC family)